MPAAPAWWAVWFSRYFSHSATFRRPASLRAACRGLFPSSIATGSPTPPRECRSVTPRTTASASSGGSGGSATPASPPSADRSASICSGVCTEVSGALTSLPNASRSISRPRSARSTEFAARATASSSRRTDPSTGPPSASSVPSLRAFRPAVRALPLTAFAGTVQVQAGSPGSSRWRSGSRSRHVAASPARAGSASGKRTSQSTSSSPSKLTSSGSGPPRACSSAPASQVPVISGAASPRTPSSSRRPPGHAFVHRRRARGPPGHTLARGPLPDPAPELLPELGDGLDDRGGVIEVQRQHATGHPGLVPDREQPRREPVPAGRAPRAELVPHPHRLAAAHQVAREEVAARGRVDDLVDAHDRAPQGLEVALGRDRLGPAAALEVVVDDVAAVRLELAGEEVLERAADQLGVGVLAEQVRQLVRRHPGGPAGGGEVGGDDVLEPAAPFLARGPLHDGCDSPVAPGSAHGPFLGGEVDRSPVDGAAADAGNPGLSSGSGHRGRLYRLLEVSPPALNRRIMALTA